MKTISKLLRGLILISVTMGCSTNVSPPYPGEKSGYPSDRNANLQIPIRINDRTRGAIIGKLLNAITNEPASGTTILLGTLLPLNPGPAHLITFDSTNAPRAEVKADGTFVFENIAPGEYGLLLWTPHETRQVEYLDDSSKELIASVEAGKITNLGTVKVVIP